MYELVVYEYQNAEHPSHILMYPNVHRQQFLSHRPVTRHHGPSLSFSHMHTALLFSVSRVTQQELIMSDQIVQEIVQIP